MNSFGETPLHQTAGVSDSLEIVKYLIKYGANVNAKDNEGDTPLSLHIKKNHIEEALYLIEHGANTNEDYNHNTYLYLAFEYKCMSVVDAIMKQYKVHRIYITTTDLKHIVKHKLEFILYLRKIMYHLYLMQLQKHIV